MLGIGYCRLRGGGVICSVCLDFFAMLYEAHSLMHEETEGLSSDTAYY